MSSGLLYMSHDKPGNSRSRWQPWASQCPRPGPSPHPKCHFWLLPSFSLTTQLPAGNQLAGRLDSNSPEASLGVQCGPASNATTSWGQAAWAAACNLGVGDGTPRSALTGQSPEEGSGLGAWGIKAFLSAALVTMKIKIFMDNFPHSGDGWAQNRTVFPLAMADPPHGRSWDKHRLFIRSRAAPERHGHIHFPLFQQGRELLESCPKEQGWVSVLC